MSVATEPLPTAGGERAVVFGPYRLLAAQRLLLEGDKPVRLGNRAFDILAPLVERAGGGIGKTTVALAVAERVIASHEHGVWLVDLASLADPRLVPTAIATLLGLEIGTEDPLPTLVAALRNNRMLLLLDNCEHVIDAVATLAAAVLSGTSDIKIVATSREPLRGFGERQDRLGPLGSPDP